MLFEPKKRQTASALKFLRRTCPKAFDEVDFSLVQKKHGEIFEEKKESKIKVSDALLRQKG